MSASRRDFLKASAASTAALTLGPVLGDADATAMAPELAPRAGTRANARLRAQPIPLDRVRLTGGPLHHAQQITARYLLSLEPDRMLSFYRKRAGLTPKAEPYGGWDGDGKNLTGHIAGHHLSGVSLMYRATGDVRFKQRADYLVRELAEVQRANGDGYVGAIGGLREAFAKVSAGDIRSASFDLNGLWSPWYTLHKTYAGLRDAYRHAGNAQALQLEIAFAAWAEGVLKPLSDAQVQKMLNTEFGGMNEILVDLYADTGNVRWLEFSRRFEHHAVTTPLKRHQDNLSGKHGNCQIPKLIGSASRYEQTGDPDDLIAATFFFDRVVRQHTYASGGHGLSEYFGPPGKLSPRVDGRAAETCNVYNMVKLSRQLFAFRPDAVYADFHERALFNHILASIDPTDGRTSYMVPVGRDEQQEYQDMQRDFTCCVGTGMESHALHGLGVFYESADTIYWNLFVPCTARSKVANASLAMDTGFPDGDTATLTITLPTAARFTVAVRRPVWAGDGFRLLVNGQAMDQPTLDSLHDPVAGGRPGGVGNESVARDSTYIPITRTWRSGDTITLALPKQLTLEPTQDDPTVTAIMWGPLAMAADVAPREDGEWSESPSLRPKSPRRVLVSETRDPRTFATPTGPAGNFTVANVVRRADAPEAAGPLMLTPFYRTHRRRYSLYHDLVTPAEYEQRLATHRAAVAAQAQLDAATIGIVRPGAPADEAAAAYKSEPADRPIGNTEGRTHRAGAGWFSVEVPVDSAADTDLLVTHFVERGLPALLADFRILANGRVLASYVPNTHGSGFYQVRYALPADLTRGAQKVTVRFEAATGSRVIPVFEVRTARR